MTSGSPPTTTSASGQTATLKPTITSFSPTSGPVGTSVVIIGEHFTDDARVNFSRVELVSTISSPTEIKATVPYGVQTGRISVNTPAGTDTSGMNFEVIDTVGLRLAMYKRLANQTNLLGAGLVGGLALFNALRAMKPFPEAILATLFVITVVLLAWARGFVDYQKELIEARKQEYQLSDLMTMPAATKVDLRIEQDIRPAKYLYLMAVIITLISALGLLGSEWYSAVEATPQTAAPQSFAEKLPRQVNVKTIEASSSKMSDLPRDKPKFAEYFPRKLGEVKGFSVGETTIDINGFEPQLLIDALNSLNDICDRWREYGNRDTIILILGATDRLPVSGPTRTRYDGNTGIALARAAAVRDWLSQKCWAIGSQNPNRDNVILLISGPQTTPPIGSKGGADDRHGFPDDRRVGVWLLSAASRSSTEAAENRNR